jgi:hypothetical protein
MKETRTPVPHLGGHIAGLHLTSQLMHEKRGGGARKVLRASSLHKAEICSP